MSGKFFAHNVLSLLTLICGISFALVANLYFTFERLSMDNVVQIALTTIIFCCLCWGQKLVGEDKNL